MSDKKSPMAGVQVKDILHEKKHDGMCFVPSTMTIHDVLGVIEDRGISSVPVWDMEKDEWMTIVGTADLIGYVVFSSWKEGQTTTKEDLESLTSFDATVGELMGSTPESEKLWKFDQDEQVDAVVEAMTKGVHRVLVDVGDKSKPGIKDVRIISQLDVLGYIMHHKEKFSQDLLRNTLANLGIANPSGNTGKVKTINAATLAVDAFRTLYQTQHSAVPVVDPEDERTLLYTLSVSDIRGLNRKNVGDLALPVGAYLFARSGEKPAVPVTVAYSDTLEDAMQKLLGGKIHRVWVTDAQGHVDGVVTASDILTQFSLYNFSEQTSK